MTDCIVTVVKAAGSFAEDKDTARELRTKCVLPAVEREQHLVLDFTSVKNVTQSFMHALIAEALRCHGEAVLDRIEFKGCNSIVQSVVETVAEYSIRAHSLGRAGPPTPALLGPTDVPQADKLETVRRVVDAIAAGATSTQDVMKLTGYTLRHVHYRLHAARVLGLVILYGRNLIGPTDEAYVLYETRPGSADELAVFERAIKRSPIMRFLVPELLGKRPLSRKELVARLERRGQLGRATAQRRAQALLAWRDYIRRGQLRLAGV